MIAIGLSLLLLISYVNAWIIGDTAMNYDQAEAWCVAEGSHLATISDITDRDETKTLCTTNDIASASGCWIGLFHDDSSNTWKWKDGSALGYGFHTNGQPTNGVDPWWGGEPNSHGEDCIHIFDGQAYNWNDLGCHGANLPLCNDQG